jgi:hypothetical protein
MNIEFHQTLVAHLQKEGLAGLLIDDIGAPHDFVDLERLLAERIQDILAIIQHDYFPLNKIADVNRLDHDEFDLAIFRDSRRKRVAGHLFDDQPIREKKFLGQHLRWKASLQNAALPRVPVRDLKGYRLRPLADLLFGGFGDFPHPLFL